MNENFGIIDLGSNTFHLLIGSITPEGLLDIKFRQREYVRLASAGIKRIGDIPYQKGIATMVAFKNQIDKFGISECKAIGTAALRKANNASQFIQEVKALTNISIEVISGEEEAQLIFEGVSKTLPTDLKNCLIMDIGGGSVEFIHTYDREILWKNSFPAGVAVLRSNFHKSDPISKFDIEETYNFLDDVMHPLLPVLRSAPELTFVGASGTFEVLEDALGNNKKRLPYSTWRFGQFHHLYEKVIGSSLEEIKHIKYIPEERRELIQVAFILINWILKKRNFDQYGISQYSLKEGALYRMSSQIFQ
jgi:exopolyphosphatase / guanosine-5'-triphosphate,3'-diphosphate pyrophosphatase